MDLSIFPPGEALPATLFAQVQQLFVASYHRYHYLGDLADGARLQVVAHDGDRTDVVGYASARVMGESVHLANLLVDRGNRGGGVGRGLELARYRWARETGLPSYVSCTCDDGSSQRLKLELGMRPVALKLGYRRDVSGPGRRGSSVVFADSATPLAEPAGLSAVRDPQRSRVRFVGAAADTLEAAVRTDSDFYVDLLVGLDDVRRLYDEPRVSPVGVDKDAATGRWHACFQVRNRAFHHGAAAGPVVLSAPDPLSVQSGLEVSR